jgi:hypothetical protein
VRQLLHALVGIAFWVLLVVLWWLLFRDGKATAAAWSGTAVRLGLCVGIVLGVTLWWVSHNVGIHRRRGARKGRADMPPNTASDRLGRRVTWDVPAGVEGARAAGHLVVELDGDAKTYRAAP